MIIKDRIMRYTGNHQILHRFENGYGASVVQGTYTLGGDEGLYELAVVKFDSEGEYDLTYDTPLTSDVLGYLTPEDVEQALEQIENLPKED